MLKRLTRRYPDDKGTWKHEFFLWDTSWAEGSTLAKVSKIYSPRIDAVFVPYSREYAIIVEAKSILNIKALGQLLAYRYFYAKQERIPEEKIKLVAVTNHAPMFMIPLFHKYDVVILTPEAHEIK